MMKVNQERNWTSAADVLQPEGGWICLAKPRILAPTPSERSLLFRSVSVFGKAFGRSEIPDVLSVFSKSPRLFWPWLAFASQMMPYGRLPATVREKIILRTAWNCRSRYEWGQHVDIALSVGVTDQEIVQLTKGANAASGELERAVLSACDEIYRNKLISDETWRVLSTHYSEKLLIEITILVGHYEMIAAFLNSAGLQLEAPIEQKLQEFYRRVEAL